jgi:hypothetical protein
MRPSSPNTPTCCPVTASTSNTVAEIYGSRPGTGPVLLGGNYVGPSHKLSEGKVGLHVVDGSSFVAKCCFVGSSSLDPRWTDLLLLGHNTTIGDLKRAFYERHKTQAMASALTSSGLQGQTEATQLDYLVCRDVDGHWLPDTDKLPRASPTSCADVGYHAMFYLDICASSMRETYVKERIKVSPAAIGNFTATPKTLAPSTFQSTTEYPSTFVKVRSELGDRLTAATKDEPARISTDELQKVKDAFRAIEPENEGSTSSMPQSIISYVETVMQEFEARDFDSLDPGFALSIANRLQVIEPFARAIAHVQTESEWINYESIADPEQNWSLEAIASMTKDLQDAVQLHEDILMLKPNTADMSKSDRDDNKKECMELAKLFDSLHKVFDQAKAKKGDLEAQLQKCEEECNKSFNRAKEAALGYDRQLQEEQSNLRKLEALNNECEAFHQMVCEQIKWCKSFVAASSADIHSSIETLDLEIQRLQALRTQEINRKDNLTKCDEHLDRMLANEKTKAAVSKGKRVSATRAATERVACAKKAVTSSGRFQTKLISLHEEVQQEMKDASSYWEELLKALAVDCHAAYLGAGKFLTMQALITEKNLKASKQTHEKTYQAKMELEQLEDADLPDTVDRAEQARRSVFFYVTLCFLIASTGANAPRNMQRVQRSQEKLRCCGR